MRFAVKSAGGISEAFLHADDVAEAAKDAARQIVEDYDLPLGLELWTPPRKSASPPDAPSFASSPSTRTATS